MNKSSIEKLRKQFIAENDGKSTIVLKGKFGKQQGPLSLSPLYDSVQEKFLGVEEMTEEDKKKSVRPIDENTTRKITEGMVIDLNRDFDVVDWAWMKETRQIAMNVKEAAQNNAALFYVYNEDTVIKEQVNKADLIFEAMSLVKNASATEKGQRTRLLLGTTSNFKELEIEHYLKDKAMNEPDLIIRLFKDKDMKTKLFLADLIEKGVLRKDPQDKAIYFNERPLGASEAIVVDMFAKPENQELVVLLKTELDSKK